MMRYQVTASDLTAIHFNESDAVCSVLQNIAVLLATPKGSDPLMRDFGLDWSCLDRPMPAAKALLRAELKEAIERWEPRASFVDAIFRQDPARPGVLIPTVEVEIHEPER